MFRVVLAAFLVVVSAAQATRNEQRNFGSDSDVERPVKLPKAVEAILQKDDNVVQVQRNENKSWSAVRKWLKASQVSLPRPNETLPNETLLVVKGEGLLLGAHAAPFWIFKLSGKSVTRVLSTMADSLEISAATDFALPDITVSNHTAVQIHTDFYRFDGTKYELIKSSDAPIQ